MLALASKVAPDARFFHAALDKFDVPPCDAVTCLGEGFNHLLPVPGTGRERNVVYDAGDLIECTGVIGHHRTHRYSRVG